MSALSWSTSNNKCDGRISVTGCRRSASGSFDALHVTDTRRSTGLVSRLLTVLYDAAALVNLQ